MRGSDVTSRPRAAATTLAFGVDSLSIEQIHRVSEGKVRVVLDDDPARIDRVRAGLEALSASLAGREAVYGVTRGFGDSCEVTVDADEIERLPENLVRFHGCGTGRMLTEPEAAAVVAVRLASLSRGYSAVRPDVLQALAELLNRRVVPVIPAEGSVGASGDLTPLSYVAACLTGEREAYWHGTRTPAAEALKEAGLEPVALAPKESLAIMNGTSVMTALGALAFRSAQRLARLSAALTAMASEMLRGSPGHFDDRIFALKPHPGQRAFARWVREDLEYEPRGQEEQARLQDRYSIRCAPHVAGVLLDMLPLSRQLIETEINSVNDNPIVDPVTGDWLNGGNFYGGHICFVMDSLKNAVANVADLLDRQLALLCNPSTSHGLPSNLVGSKGAATTSNFGFKAMQISASALTAEALKLTMPASVFSRSTENHNQDKVSMGTIAARDCGRVLELTETVAMIHLLALCQAADLRKMQGCHSRSRALYEAVRRTSAKHERDRAMDGEIRSLLETHRSDQLPIGDLDWCTG